MEKIVSIPDFWIEPPWGHGNKKYRLGLKPISIDDWFEAPPDEDLLNYKEKLLKKNYKTVVRAVPESEAGQEVLSEIFELKNTHYPDKIADCSLKVQDDLCLIESNDEQKFLAACVCSPSYWDLSEKIGKTLKEVHEPVKTLNKKIGTPIQKFIANSPVMKPFVRQNWFIHEDTKRMHLKEEKMSHNKPDNWHIRSERETICRINKNFSLFAINVRFQPLNLIHQYPLQKEALFKSIERLDKEETHYFGGEEKKKILLEFLGRDINSEKQIN